MIREVVVDKDGRIELPENLLERHNVEPGNGLYFEELANGEIVFRFGADIRDLFGIMPNNGIHLTIEEINGVIASQGLLT